MGKSLLGRFSLLVAASAGKQASTQMSSAISKASYNFHLDRITYFVEDETTWNSIDLVAFETLPRLVEVEAVRMIMETIQTKPASTDFWISCVFPDDDELADGSTISQVVAAMLSE